MEAQQGDNRDNEKKYLMPTGAEKRRRKDHVGETKVAKTMRGGDEKVGLVISDDNDEPSDDILVKKTRPPPHQNQHHLQSGDDDEEEVWNIADVSRQLEFEELPLDERLLAGLKRRRFEKPTKLQQVCIPIVASGVDTLIKAPPGTGKTFCYGLPVLSALCSQQSVAPPSGSGVVQKETSALTAWRWGVEAVVLEPSKELVTQVHDVLSKVSFPCWDSAGLFVWKQTERPKRVEDLEIFGKGGVGGGGSSESMNMMSSILITQPGALLQMCKTVLRHLISDGTNHSADGMIRIFPNLKHFVVDEADLLLVDFGFDSDVRELFSPTPNQWFRRNVSIVPRASDP